MLYGTLSINMGSGLKAELLLPANINKLDQDSWKVIKEAYASLIHCNNIVDSELENWKQAIEDKVVPSTKHLPEAVDFSENLFPNIFTVLKVLLVMPVSTATPERTFSCLRRLKTYLRNNMTDERMSALALMNLHQGRTISAEQVLREFDATGHRRIALAFN